MKLPALLLSKNVDPDPIRGPSLRWSVLLPEDPGTFRGNRKKGP